MKKSDFNNWTDRNTQAAVLVKLDEKERDMIKNAARKIGVSMNVFILGVAVIEARKVLNKGDTKG